MNTLTRFLRDDTAATSIEYALIAAGIAVAIVAVVLGVGTALNARYETIKAAVN